MKSAAPLMKRTGDRLAKETLEAFGVYKENQASSDTVSKPRKRIIIPFSSGLAIAASLVFMLGLFSVMQSPIAWMETTHRGSATEVFSSYTNTELKIYEKTLKKVILENYRERTSPFDWKKWFSFKKEWTLSITFLEKNEGELDLEINIFDPATGNVRETRSESFKDIVDLDGRICRIGKEIAQRLEEINSKQDF